MQIAANELYSRQRREIRKPRISAKDVRRQERALNRPRNESEQEGRRDGIRDDDECSFGEYVSFRRGVMFRKYWRRNRLLCLPARSFGFPLSVPCTFLPPHQPPFLVAVPPRVPPLQLIWLQTPKLARYIRRT